MVERILKSLVVLAAASLPAVAHPGEPLAPHDLPGAWTFEPGIVIPLVIVAILYWKGARAARGFRSWETACFWSGWAVLALSLLSPLHPLGEALFSAHMAQHELIMAVAAPLLLLGRPSIALLWALPLNLRRNFGALSRIRLLQRFWKLIAAPFAAWLIHGLVLWIWHIPALFDLTLESDLIHSAQHLSFLGAAMLYWWSLYHLHGRTGRGLAVVSLFATGIHSVLLGALLTIAPLALYPGYAGRTAAWNLTPLEDQQLAGLIMWVPACIIYVGAGLALASKWLKESEQTTPDEGVVSWN